MRIDYRLLSVCVGVDGCVGSNNMLPLPNEVPARRASLCHQLLADCLFILRQRPALRILLQHQQVRTHRSPILLEQVVSQPIRPNQMRLAECIPQLLRVMVDIVARNDIRQDAALSQTVQPLQHIVPVNHLRRISTHLQRRIAIRIVEHADIAEGNIRTHQVVSPKLVIGEVLEAVNIHLHARFFSCVQDCTR